MKAVLMLTSLLISTHLLAQDGDVVLDQIVAVVNDGIIIASELEAETQFLVQQARGARQTLPSGEALRQRVLERLINQELQRQRAAELGIEIDQSSVNKAIEQIATNNRMNTFEFRQTLQKEGIDYNQFRSNIQAELLLSRLIQREVEQAIAVSQQEINDYISSSTSQKTVNRSYRLRHILLAVPSSAPSAKIEAVKQRAQKLVAQLRSGASFGSVAASESDGRYALQGGDLGWRKLNELPSFLHDALLQLEAGRSAAADPVSDPIQSKDGFHIIRLDDVRNEKEETLIETRLRHIYIEAANDAESEAARARLLELRERLMAGADFTSLAREYSDDPGSSVAGGDLPWFTPGKLPPELERAADALQPGDLSEPVKTAFGWHLLQLLERRNAQLSDASMRREAELNLRQTKIEEESERWSRRLRSEAFVEVRN